MLKNSSRIYTKGTSCQEVTVDFEKAMWSRSVIWCQKWRLKDVYFTGLKLYGERFGRGRNRDLRLSNWSCKFQRMEASNSAVRSGDLGRRQHLGTVNGPSSYSQFGRIMRRSGTTGCIVSPVDHSIPCIFPLICYIDLRSRRPQDITPPNYKTYRRPLLLRYNKHELRT